MSAGPVRTIGQHLVAAWPRLFGYAMRLTREPEAARDLMQQTALQALSARSTPVEATAARAYLYRIVRHAWIDGLRRMTVRAEAVQALEAVEPLDDGLIDVIAVRQAFASLDEPCRQVVACVDVEGLSYREAADALGIPIGTVMSRLHRARREMLRRIGGAEHEVRSS